MTLVSWDMGRLDYNSVKKINIVKTPLRTKKVLVILTRSPYISGKWKDL